MCIAHKVTVNVCWWVMSATNFSNMNGISMYVVTNHMHSV